MEFFSHVHPIAPVILYVPAVVYMLYRALVSGKMAISIVFVLFVFGVLPLAILFYFLFAISFRGYAPAIWAGLVSGYVCYDMIHYATHHFAMRNGVGFWLKQYHLRHHYQDDEAGYGVSSPLWDYIFGTTRK